jgi:large subunit ribosomal protein L16
MLSPKTVKYRRPQRVYYEGHVKGRNHIINGDWALVATEGNWVSNKQIEAARVAMTRYTKRLAKVWINIFPHLARTKKPAEVRMGSGKGKPESWVAVVKDGKVLFELKGVADEIAKEALRLAAHKLCVKTKIVKKEDYEQKYE